MNHTSYKIVLSDLHLGSGIFDVNGAMNHREDFLFDQDMVELIHFYCNDLFKFRDVEIILNGDTFEMFEVSEYDKNPLYLTAKMAIEHISRIIKGHTLLFNKLKNFLQIPGKSLRIIVGNHDQALLFPEVQQFLKEVVSQKIEFSDRSYQFLDVHIEHGHHFIPNTSYDEKKPFISDKNGENILNHGWGAIFCLSVLYRYKKITVDYKSETGFYFPLYKITPITKALKSMLFSNFYITCIFIFMLIRFSIKSLLFSGNSRLPSLKLNKRILKSFSFDGSTELLKSAKNLLENKKINTVVFGHSHRRVFRKLNSHKKIYINTGSWNPEIDIKHKIGILYKFSYAFIIGRKKNTRAYLKEWIGHQKPDRTIYLY